MGGCYSAIKGMRKENGQAPLPQAAKEETATKGADQLPIEETPVEVATPSEEEATPVVCVSKEVTISEVVSITSEVSVPLKEKATSEVVAVPLKDAATEAALAPKEEATENTTSTAAVNLTTKEVTIEASDVSYKIYVKETEKGEDEEENKDGEKVVDDSKRIEKNTLKEETGAKVEVTEVVASKDIETKKEHVEVVKKQETDKKPPA